jgi:PmbA protein
MLNIDRARETAEQLISQAIKAGADAADAIYVGDRSSSVQVRLGELENVHRSEGEQIGLRLFVGSRSASVATSDFSTEALAALVERCVAMAGQAPEDPYAGLAPPELLLKGEPPFVDGDDGQEPDPAVLRERAYLAEQAALAVPGVTNSSGGSGGASANVIALATSGGFSGAYRTSGHSCSAGVIAGEGSTMQRDHAWHSARHLEDLDSAQDRLGERVFAAGVSIVDDPLRLRGLRSRPFDGEGLPVSTTAFVSDGVLQTWIATSAAARQLGIAPTGHAARGVGGAPGASPSNVYIAAGNRSRDELLAAFPEAVLITELIGMGVNGVTGDYSRGAAGFMARGGAVAEPVAEITIASNLIEMFATLEPGSDLEFRRGMDAPTLLVPDMTVAAA